MSRRVDEELVSRNLVVDLTQAHLAIEERRVLIDGAIALKPESGISRSSQLRVLADDRMGGAFASRAGMKLDGALGDFGIDVEDLDCLDAGAGHGGFTDCLLRRGARHVVAVDVGRGLLDLRLRNDPGVTVMESTNLRTVDPAHLGGPVDLVVADLSFISLTKVLPTLVSVARPTAALVLMVKPQFEAPRRQVESGGIVTDPKVVSAALGKVAGSLTELGFGLKAVTPSRVRGRSGNLEYFLLCRRGLNVDASVLIEAAIEMRPF